jgi:hypothetical protein
MNQLTNTNENTEEGRSRRIGLTKFEELIRDAIALLIKRGAIKIPRKKRRPLPPTLKTQRQVPPPLRRFWHGLIGILEIVRRNLLVVLESPIRSHVR